MSVGSTPAALSAQHLEGVTEIRAGVYVFHDLVMVNIGVASTDDVILSVLTTVIGHQKEKGWAFVDAAAFSVACGLPRSVGFEWDGGYPWRSVALRNACDVNGYSGASCRDMRAFGCAVADCCVTRPASPRRQATRTGWRARAVCKSEGRQSRAPLGNLKFL